MKNKARLKNIAFFSALTYDIFCLFPVKKKKVKMKKILKVPNQKNIICTLIQSKKKWLSPSSLSTLKWVRKNELNFVKLRLVLQWSWNYTSLAFFHFSTDLGSLLASFLCTLCSLCLETFMPANFHRPLSSRIPSLLLSFS